MIKCKNKGCPAKNLKTFKDPTLLSENFLYVLIIILHIKSLYFNFITLKFIYPNYLLKMIVT